jgi:glycosyltransferase involved in cell wall biosynthesis
MTPTRILCVAEDFPWPQHSGYKIRLANVIRALTEVGEVDCFFVVNDGMPRPPCVVPNDVPVARATVVEEGMPTSTSSRLGRWMTGQLPRGLLWRRWAEAPDRFTRFATGHYDIVWFSHIDTYLALGALVDAPAIVDLDTLEDFRLRLQIENDARTPARSVRARLRDQVARIDLGRWERIEHRVAREVAAVVLCSDLDRARLGEPNCVVVPNGYDAPETAPESGPGTGRTHAGEPGGPRPVMTMVGDYGYEPNREAAQWFAEFVLPLVRASLPEAEFRLVGRVEPVADLARHAGVNLRGRVDDITVELAEADLEVVPLHSGSGTRVKVLEAFAHRVPVVSTTIGCEGIDADDGTHVLIADEPDAFATACYRVARDDALRARLMEAAYELYSDRYHWSVVRPVVCALVTRVLGGAADRNSSR